MPVHNFACSLRRHKHIEIMIMFFTCSCRGAQLGVQTRPWSWFSCLNFKYLVFVAATLIVALHSFIIHPTNTQCMVLPLRQMYYDALSRPQWNWTQRNHKLKIRCQGYIKSVLWVFVTENHFIVPETAPCGRKPWKRPKWSPSHDTSYYDLIVRLLRYRRPCCARTIDVFFFWKHLNGNTRYVLHKSVLWCQ